MKVDFIVADRGLDCCCEVKVRFLLFFRPDLTPPSSPIQIPAGVRAAGVGIMSGKSI